MSINAELLLTELNEFEEYKEELFSNSLTLEFNL